jgi:hypothetical protein
MVSALFYEQRRKTAQHGRDLKESAHLHRAIYHAIRAHDAKRASAAMSEHLSVAQQAQALESPLRDDRTAPLDAPAALMSVNGTGMPSINGTNGTSMVAGPSNGSVGASVHGPAARRPIRQAARLLPSPLR